ncbi:MAG: hypothetical protein COB37_10755 [Kordiimonadales bacterium]|nr:MAG: hypothetical protein COB37_10755 [Kordiimonadales bacterium]
MTEKSRTWFVRHAVNLQIFFYMMSFQFLALTVMIYSFVGWSSENTRYLSILSFLTSINLILGITARFFVPKKDKI